MAPSTLVEFYETTAWSATIWSLTGCLLITVAADTRRILSLRGTYRRYVWATVEHATIYPTMVGIFLQVVVNIAERDWFWTGIALATAIYYVFLLWRLRRDHDDDWFNSGGPGQLLSRRPSGGRPAPQGH